MTAPARPHRVLVVDDEEKILAHCQALLSARGYDVVVSAEPERVLPRLQTESYDLILLDIRMPGLEGTDLLPLIKHQHPALPVVLLSAFCDAAEAGHYVSLGAFDVVGKPFSNEQLLDCVARAMQERVRIPLTLQSLSLIDGRDTVYRKLMLTALTRTNWNQVKAAELLGVSRYCLMRWMRKLGIAG